MIHYYDTNIYSGHFELFPSLTGESLRHSKQRIKWLQIKFSRVVFFVCVGCVCWCVCWVRVL